MKIKSNCHIHAKIEDKVKFIKNNKKVHDVRKMCKALEIACSEYYYQINKKKNSYEEAKEKLDKEIKEEYEKSKGRYGSPKIQKILEKREIKARKNGIRYSYDNASMESINIGYRVPYELENQKAC